ncbi:GAF domain-containing protein [Pseudonocardia sp. KRD-184]|uniref:GAF domain-containing protein n=1 Tax=Pseudonocardia oceani TaxID=2792013 RepID=A0ABS6U837_9PSEU|nr:helix-turn-helix domain-containing protein [Pseudonocardia oceani]MBW0088693.1 GAF domain-containing protein [Pseudonocardia oceani]MBW0095570.1 GAF domain-containing protein [Pseudonocardia oceani]MBW0110588.1 GAF domain-containing protein [Pseudonocardia oceani]MBW0120671.1 GAF domain-containing protein [Pseudonocardia oceani]MBW0128395.1 GAF domain-containing protein [Pseudonocardia oceani]
MGDVLARRRLLTSARARLLDHPDADLPGIPDQVAASWRRSVASGVDPSVITNLHHPDLDVGSRLVRCARPVVEQLAEQIGAVPVCVVLTDDRARLLVRIDTTAAIGRAADENSFAEGFGYEEGAVGTNGVGTVLEAGRSVHVVGAEHFVESLHPYACAGAPVRDPFTGRVEGVLDVSCRAEHSSPILHSLVATAATRIQDALLQDRDRGQQALFDLYARVDARARRAVLAVGRRTVLANTLLHTLLDPGDLAALQEHARFRMGREHDVDDRLDLPSGVRVRMRGTVVTVGSTVAGLVAAVSVLREADGIALHRRIERPLPETASSSPAWRGAWTSAAEALRSGAPLLVVGEPGSGRRRLLTDLDRALHGAGHVVEVGPADVTAEAAAADRVRGAGPSPLVVLADVDRWDDLPPGLTAALHARRARLAATTGNGARHAAAVAEVLTGFRRSVTVPPLRNRSGDLPALVTGLLADLAPGRDARLSADALRALARHSWPGNVRELREALGEALLHRPVGMVEVGDLPASCQSAPRSTLRPVDQAERDAIVVALRESAGNRVAAAAALGVARSTLYRKIAHYGITA